MASQLTTTALQLGQKFSMVPIKTDGEGNAVPFVGVPQWSSSDGTIATVTPAEDGLSAIVEGVSAGTASITVTGDSLTGLWGVNVTGAAILFMVSPASVQDGN